MVLFFHPPPPLIPKSQERPDTGKGAYVGPVAGLGRCARPGSLEFPSDSPRAHLLATLPAGDARREAVSEVVCCGEGMCLVAVWGEAATHWASLVLPQVGFVEGGRGKVAISILCVSVGSL
uniref:Uncharacterized protein n=1 Tax=Arundo donax TaxID=35708 RepID=A0A0A9GDG7_ARUDO